MTEESETWLTKYCQENFSNLDWKSLPKVIDHEGNILYTPTSYFTTKWVLYTNTYLQDSRMANKFCISNSSRKHWTLEPFCWKRRQKNPNQETGLGNRGVLKILNDTKLILNDSHCYFIRLNLKKRGLSCFAFQHC